MKPIRVLIVDDHPVVRTGLRGMFETDPSFEVAGEAGDGAQAIERVTAERPDVVLMDLQMPVMDGVEAIARIRALPDPPPVLVLTVYDSDSQILRAIEAGASGYLLKDAARDELFGAVRSAMAGGSPLAPAVATRLMTRLVQAPSSGPEPLSGRELEVIRLVSMGRSNKEIAFELRISEATVKTHLAHAFEKLGVTDRTSAVTTAMERGLIELPTRLRKRDS
jgi:DNA-binding NarL/FixJ family response regulator